MFPSRNAASWRAGFLIRVAILGGPLLREITPVHHAFVLLLWGDKALESARIRFPAIGPHLLLSLQTDFCCGRRAMDKEPLQMICYWSSGSQLLRLARFHCPSLVRKLAMPEGSR